jgi:phage terminase large subunit
LQTENKYLYSKAYFKILNLIQSNPNEDVFVICGGQGAGKTISIVELIIQSLISETIEATILSSELSKMKRTVMRDYIKICKDWGIIAEQTDFNRSESKHEYPNDSYIDFLGADTSDVGKGFRRDILYINEADKLNIDQAVQFISRAKLTIIDYNPDNIFWGDDYINENNFLRLTFEDNEYLPDSERKSILDYRIRGFKNPDLPIDKLFEDTNIKSKYWANKWKVYGLGLVGSINGVVFENWTIVDAIPKDARLKFRGVDFGYATSQFAALDIYEFNGEYYLNELVYKTGLTNPMATDEIKKANPQNIVTYCDSAEPKSIQELRDNGINAVACDSKTDIKKYAVQKLNTKNFNVTKKSINLVDELRVYVYDEKTNQPKKSKKDHLMDAMLYAIGSDGKYNGKY